MEGNKKRERVTESGGEERERERRGGGGDLWKSKLRYHVSPYWEPFGHVARFDS